VALPINGSYKQGISMKKILMSILALTAWSSATQPFFGNSFLAYRSQGINGAREIVGWQQLRNELFAQEYTGNLSLALEYTQSFNACALNNYFFGGQSLTISGSRVANRGACDIMADYFGLPTDFQSSICFNPRIQNLIADLDWYWRLSGCCNGLYLHVNTPITYTRWNLNACERVSAPGVLDYPAGYMDKNLISRSELPTTALQTLSGNATFGDMDTPLQFGKICGLQTKTGLADIYVALGYTALSSDNGHLGFNVHTIIPTGTRSTACTLFEPQFGNGHHWALGVGVTSHYDFWSDESGERGISAYLDAQVQHLFGSYQRRSYDFCRNGCGSRYMLIMDMPQRVAGTIGFGNTLIEQQFNGRLFHAIDKTTFTSKIKVDVQAEITCKLSAFWNNWDIDLGYNFWVRTQEKLLCRDRLPNNYYGVKGDAQTVGYIVTGVPGFNVPIPINATQHDATLHAGQSDGNTTMNFTNNNADNADLMSLLFVLPLTQTNPESVGANTGVDSLAQINGSNQAILLTDADINNCSGLSPRGLSNKVFGHIGYTWYERARTTPYVGIGGEAEFGACTQRVKSAVSQWGIWVKGGFTY
jgi:hypothetical protein